MHSAPEVHELAIVGISGESCPLSKEEPDIDPEGFVENVADKAGILDRRVKADMKRFKEFIESRGAPTGSWRWDVDRPDA